MNRPTSKSLVIPLAVVALLFAVAVPGVAQVVDNSGNGGNGQCQTNFLTLPVTGTFSSNGQFSGTLTLRSFSGQRSGGQIMAVFTVGGTLNGAGENNRSIGQVISVPVAITDITASCDQLKITFSSSSATLDNNMVSFAPFTVTIDSSQGTRRLRNNMCTVANMIDHNNTNPRALANVLNNVLKFAFD